MNDLDPLPLDDVLAIVDRRSRRRQRLALRGTLGAGAVAAAVVGVAVADGPTPTTPAQPTPTTPLLPDGPPAWQVDAATYAFETADFGYDDAAALAAVWQVEPFTAKAVVGEALRGGASADLGRVVAGEAGDDVAAAVQIDLFDAYWTAGYDVGDAEEHGARWGTAILDTKLLIGVRAAVGLPPDDQ